MSGGHFEYANSKINMIIDNIEREFVNDGKYQTEDYSRPEKWPRPTVEADRIGDSTEKERPLVLSEIRDLIVELKRCSDKVKSLEWYMSGDTGATDFLNETRSIKKRKYK